MSVLQKDYVAVITGAAAGIGAAAARYCSAIGMRLALLDMDGEALAKLASQLPSQTIQVVGDVTDRASLQELHDRTYEAFGQVNLLFNNAGLGLPTSPWSDVDNWRRTMEVNLFSILEAQALFVPSLLNQGSPVAIVNLGSKEGITTPPGNVAYSVSKAGVKVLTEQLAHELRQIPDHQVTAHLLVPGYTWTPMNFPDADFTKPETKPEEPWSTEELMAYFGEELAKGTFYILAGDNEVTPELDRRRIQWAADDLIKNRPALSRWHPDYKQAFADYINQSE